MKRRAVWYVVIAAAFLLTAACVGVKLVSEKRAEGMERVEAPTRDSNRSIVYDQERGILYTGGHNGTLAAYRDGEKLWEAKAEGAHRKLVLGKNGEKLYAANEANRVYVYRTSDGQQLLSVNVQRRVVGLAVDEEESRIAVITNTGESKSNLIFYSPEGEELSNIPYTTQLKGIEFCDDNETLLLANKRGEITRITQRGEALDMYRVNFEVIQMKKWKGTYWAVAKNGIYVALDQDLNCIRSGKIDNTVKAKISAVGVDTEGRYVLVGTEEGYLFVMDEKDRQIYMADMKAKITDTGTSRQGIYVAGYGDYVWQAHADNLAHIGLYQSLSAAAQYGICIFAAVTTLGILMCIPKAKSAAAEFLKKIWRYRMAYLMLLPIFLLLFFFNYRGTFRALVRAFTNWSAGNHTAAEIDFIGLDNFRTMVKEGYFMVGIRNLILILATNVLKHLTVPMLVAWLIYSIKGDRRKYVHRFLFVLPIVVPGVVGALVWQKIYDPSIGLLNQILGALHLESWQRVWLGDAKTAIWAVIFMGFPFVSAMALLVYYGGLINIGDDMIESAMIDGGGRWEIFWKIQLPMIRPQISMIMTLTILSSMKEFNSIYILTSGGPGTATYVPALELYLNVKQYGRYGYASALGILLLIATVAVTMVSNRLTRGKEE